MRITINKPDQEMKKRSAAGAPIKYPEINHQFGFAHLSMPNMPHMHFPHQQALFPVFHMDAAVKAFAPAWDIIPFLF